MKKLIIIAFVCLCVSQNASARMGFYETTCSHNGVEYAHVRGDSSCPDYVVHNHGTPQGTCATTVSHQGLAKGVTGSQISSISCPVVNHPKQVGTAHCTIERNTTYNDPYL